MLLKHSAHLYQEWQMLPMTLKTLKTPMFTENDNKSLRLIYIFSGCGNQFFFFFLKIRVLYKYQIIVLLTFGV
ncbi:hypothetical protein HanIR_Chr13g0655591 [Helianthus annuus]|nr:hypothetical protein HanIR_Chr13g0655591 [Helianthus annuus]